METIASFQIDHTKLPRGLYISRVDGDITTYDIRTRRPNAETVMENAAIHTVEHLFATYVRNTPFAGQIVYFGPMGCRTGFYFLTRGLPDAQAIVLVQEAFAFIASYTGEIPGASERECGNYREHDREGACAEARAMTDVLRGWTAEMLGYPE